MDLNNTGYAASMSRQTIRQMPPEKSSPAETHGSTVSNQPSACVGVVDFLPAWYIISIEKIVTSNRPGDPDRKDDPMSRTVLITGASRGIGKACAERFAKEGCDLILNCRQSERELTDLAASLVTQYGIRCRFFIGDVGNYRFVDQMFAQIDRLDVLVNNAGISHVGLLHTMTPEEWMHVINVNLNSCFFTARHAVPLMLLAHSGHIINISSVWGCVGASMETAYSASKAGVNGFTKALAKELAPSHICVNAVACGIIDTDMNRRLSAEEISSIKEEIPADRLGTAEEIAQTVLQLAHAPEYLTGQIITVDGGWT